MKSLKLIILLSLATLFVGCFDSLNTDTTKPSVNPPQWLYGEWEPIETTDVPQYMVFKIVEHDVLAALVENGVQEPYSSYIVTESVYTEVEVTDTSYIFYIETHSGLISETVQHIKLSNTSMIRSVFRDGNETFRDTMVVR